MTTAISHNQNYQPPKTSTRTQNQSTDDKFNGLGSVSLFNNPNQQMQIAAALNDSFTNRQAYACECASPMSLLNLKSSLARISTEDFNQHAGQHDFGSNSIGTTDRLQAWDNDGSGIS
ncbi:MAG TPA: hypothetical protein PLM98_16785 [Thiolinea sp.]|nr:hypothetical protein [Thiolinea sp.]